MEYVCKDCGNDWWKPDELPVIKCPECGGTRLTSIPDTETEYD